ncbi:SGNH hydrolase-type esterase domain-containing protein [Obelidium mucronatum]|nr:SGNH hydrolase-type esterase domain-containing protein [Obelidium mucronatum]
MTYDQFILLGDSLTERGIRPDGWGTLLSSNYSRRLEVKIRGFSGYNSWNLKYVVASVLNQAPPERVRLVTLLIGTNDYSLPGGHQHVPVAEYRSNLGDILDTITTLVPSAKLLVMTPPPMGAHKLINAHTYLLSNARIYRDACIATAKEFQRNHKNVELLDLWKVLIKNSTDYNAESWDPSVIADLFYDSLHFNGKGNEILFDGIKSKIEEAWPDLSWKNVPYMFPSHELVPIAESKDVDGLKKVLFENSHKNNKNNK